MGAVTRMLGSLLTSIVLVGCLAPLAHAQLLDPPPTTPEAAGTEASASDRAPGPPEPDSDDAPTAEGPPRPAAKETAEPPRSLAWPTRSPRPDQPTEPKERRPLLILFLSLLGIGLALFVVERARSWVAMNVALRRVLGALVLLLRVAGAGVLIAIVLELIPKGQDWILWTLVVLALVVGWSIRDIFADLVAGGILAAERRVKKGVWVSGDGFQGTVEGRSLRATWLRDGQGHRLTVPNRAMVGAPMVYDAGPDAEHEVVVRLQGYDDAGDVRMALTDAILSSPWVLAGATPIVLRDPADPVVWRVRTKLLEPRFSVHFEGELLERVEDLLRYETPIEAGDSDEQPSEE